MPLIELLRPEQRVWLRRLRKRIANRELMRRVRADIDRKLLCPGVDLPIEAGTCGDSSRPRAAAASAAFNRRRWLLDHAFNNAEVAITALLETTAAKTTHPKRPTRPPTRTTPSRCSTTCPLSAIPACAGSGCRRVLRYSSGASGSGAASESCRHRRRRAPALP